MRSSLGMLSCIFMPDWISWKLLYFLKEVCSVQKFKIIYLNFSTRKVFNMRIKTEIQDVLYFFPPVRISKVKPELLKCSIKRLDQDRYIIIIIMWGDVMSLNISNCNTLKFHSVWWLIWSNRTIGNIKYGAQSGYWLSNCRQR